MSKFRVLKYFAKPYIGLHQLAAMAKHKTARGKAGNPSHRDGLWRIKDLDRIPGVLNEY
jgi:hypothetical protein